MIDDDVLQQAFAAHTAGRSHFTRRMAIAIALLLDVKPRAIVLRLEQLQLLRPGSWQWFVDNGGITRDQVDQVAASLSPHPQH